MPTIREIAELAGVSKSTVSLVLNNKPGVSEEMRRTVLTAVSELETTQANNSLRDHPSSEVIVEYKSQSLSMMVLHPKVLRSSYVFSQVLQGIQSASQHYNIQLRLVVNEPASSAHHVSHLYLTDQYLRPDGVLVFGAKQHEPLVEQVVENNIPCVVLGREAKKYKYSGIERDETRYAYLLTEHLLSLGHRSVAFVGGDEGFDFTHTRLRGYQQAMDDAGLAKQAIFSLGDGADAVDDVLHRAPGITAIIFVNDTYALEGLSVLADYGKRIPQDVSVASFDNTAFAQHHQPALTSISYNHFKEGEWAVKMLVEQIRFPYIETSQMVFTGELVVRESTCVVEG